MAKICKKIKKNQRPPKRLDFRSPAFEAIHSAAHALYRHHHIDSVDMQEFDGMCLKSKNKFL